MMKHLIKVLLLSIFCAFSAINFAATNAFAQTEISLSNSNFEDGLEGWGTRSKTEGVYNIAAPGFESAHYAELKIAGNEPERDLSSVYFNRRDLPTDAGYYRFSYAAKSNLEKGNAGIRIVSFDADGKVLLSLNSGAPGIPAIKGNTDWTKYDVVYQVPPAAKMVVVQLELNGGVGIVGYDAANVEKLSDDMGKKLLGEQSTRMIIPPFKQMPERTPQYPLKTQKMIFTDVAVAAARANIQKYPQAQELRDSILAEADKWVDWDDKDLIRMMPSAQVPRAFDLNVHGCPVHGDAIFKYGTYPWILDPKHPFQVECPIDHAQYPSNDFEKYIESDFKDRAGMDQKYADDGWGWADPETGERYWFVAYANQWIWYRTVEPAMRNLARAYVLTGNKKYAHKAAIMLYRLAQVYPSMDYDKQSRYAMLMHQQGGTYNGKVLNLIWETFFAQDFAESYDAVWDAIDGDAELQKFYGKSGEQIRSFIEANLLEDAVDAYFENKIRGNFGMHQMALLRILLARQNADTKKYFSTLVDDPGKDRPHTGLRYALYNQVWRDGIGFESPGYNQLWIRNFALLAHSLKQGGFDLFADPKLKMLFDAPLKFSVLGKFTPAIGDSSSVIGALTGQDSEIYQIAYDVYNDSQYLPWIAAIGRTGANGFKTFDSLFLPMLPETKPLPNDRAIVPQKSRLFAGYGVGILNNAQDSTALSFTYGKHISHFHWDFLNFELFANGQKMMPDLGYPDAMNAFVSEIYTWSNNTIAHNTVVVDASKQRRNLPGILHDFANGTFVRSMDASSPAYDQTSQYRRNLIMVDADENHSYVVDVFRVDGGKQHDYSLHGSPGKVTTSNGKWSNPAPGTFAGKDVKLGEIYDDPKLGAKDYKGSFSGYRGSGFQHLFNVQQLQSGNANLQYAHVEDENAKLRIHLLPYEKQEVFMADAWDKPRQRNHEVKYLIARRKSADGEPLKSTFVSVLEPHGDAPFIQSAKTIKLDKGTGVAVEVQRQNATDIIVSDTESSVKVLLSGDLETDANYAVITLDKSGNLTRVFFSGGTYLKHKNQRFTAAKITGKVLSVTPNEQSVTVELSQPTKLSAAEIAQRVAHFSNRFHDSAHPLESAQLQGNRLKLKTADSLLIGRLRLTGVTEKTLTTDTELPFSETYDGATLTNEKWQPVSLIKEVIKGEISLAANPQETLQKGDDAWISDVGIGDELTLKSTFEWIENER